MLALKTVITLDPILTERERTAVLARELIRDERGGPFDLDDAPGWWLVFVDRDDRLIDNEVADRLIPAAELEQWVDGRASDEFNFEQVAETFDTTEEVARTALRLRGRPSRDTEVEQLRAEVRALAREAAELRSGLADEVRTRRLVIEDRDGVEHLHTENYANGGFAVYVEAPHPDIDDDHRVHLIIQAEPDESIGLPSVSICTASGGNYAVAAYADRDGPAQ